MGLGSVEVCEIWEDNGECGVGVVKRDYWVSDSGMAACERLVLVAVVLIPSVSPENDSVVGGGGSGPSSWLLISPA